MVNNIYFTELISMIMEALPPRIELLTLLPPSDENDPIVKDLLLFRRHLTSAIERSEAAPDVRMQAEFIDREIVLLLDNCGSEVKNKFSNEIERMAWS